VTRLPSLRQLEYLVALSETRHFRRAAERCNTTQPTLSEQIKSLEKRLGVQLIERHRSGVLLTSIGAQITEVARRILRDAGEIRSIAAGADQTLRGVLRLGVPSTIGPYLLPHIVPDIHRAYPELKLYVREDLPQILARALEAGDYDLISPPCRFAGRNFIRSNYFASRFS
jgi:LysR family hydrogen peroxide-inducible transcriptional activator